MHMIKTEYKLFVIINPANSFNLIGIDDQQIFLPAIQMSKRKPLLYRTDQSEITFTA